MRIVLGHGRFSFPTRRIRPLRMSLWGAATRSYLHRMSLYGRTAIIVAVLCALPFSSCDQWTGTVLRNDLDHTVRFRLYFQQTGSPAYPVRVAGQQGHDTVMWVCDFREGPVPCCHPPTGSVERRDTLPLLDAETVARWRSAACCMDSLSAGVNVLHWSLAPSEQMSLARSLGRIPGTYLDSLVMEDSGGTYALQSTQAIFDAIEVGRSEHRLDVSSILSMGVQR